MAGLLLKSIARRGRIIRESCLMPCRWDKSLTDAKRRGIWSEYWKIRVVGQSRELIGSKSSRILDERLIDERKELRRGK